MSLEQAKQIEFSGLNTPGEITRLNAEIEKLFPGYARFQLSQPGSSADTWTTNNSAVSWFIVMWLNTFVSSPHLMEHHRQSLKKLMYSHS